MENIELIEEVTEQEIPVEDENIEITVNYDYDELINKPQINGVELVGNKSLGTCVPPFLLILIPSASYIVGLSCALVTLSPSGYILK